MLVSKISDIQIQNQIIFGLKTLIYKYLNAKKYNQIYTKLPQYLQVVNLLLSLIPLLVPNLHLIMIVRYTSLYLLLSSNISYDR